jgi:hypothetical protein
MKLLMPGRCGPTRTIGCGLIPPCWEAPQIGSRKLLGRRGAVKAMKIDYRNLTVDEVQSRLKAFPMVYERIENCRQIIRDVARKSEVKFAMLCGREGGSCLVSLPGQGLF